jgi:hypothetical protein
VTQIEEYRDNLTERRRAVDALTFLLGKLGIKSVFKVTSVSGFWKYAERTYAKEKKVKAFKPRIETIRSSY